MKKSKSTWRSKLSAPFLLLLLSIIALKNYYSSLSSSIDSGNYCKEEKDIFRGEWVRDSVEPYYTNRTCGTIQEHQNCMKYGRPDVGYLKWRWQPDGCDLRRFDAGRFLKMMKGKSMAFVGDSIARNHMQSLMCLLSQVAHPRDLSPYEDANFKRMYYPSYSFTISIFWSPFLVKFQQTTTFGLNNKGYWDLYLDEPDDAWVSQMGKFDYVIISGGNWFTRPSVYYEKQKIKGCRYCHLSNVTELSMHYAHNVAFRTAFDAINNLSNFKGTVILRTVSPSHFEHGEWNEGGDCQRMSPYKRNVTKMKAEEQIFYEAQLEEFLRAGEEGKRRGMEFRLMDVTRAMMLRPDGHPSRFGHWPHERVEMYNDCVHWCLPGPIDSWGDFLIHMLS